MLPACFNIAGVCDAETFVTEEKPLLLVEGHWLVSGDYHQHNST